MLMGMYECRRCAREECVSDVENNPILYPVLIVESNANSGEGISVEYTYPSSVYKVVLFAVAPKTLEMRSA
jgi:hypothetical protein